MNPERIVIRFTQGRLMHNKEAGTVFESSVAKFSITKDLISIGCTDITPEAAKFILDKYNEFFPPVRSDRIIIQS